MEKLKKIIVITSIFNPTKAIECYSAKEDYHLIVVGDKKTPSKWECKNTEFLSQDIQLNLNYNILKKLPWNHYCRKMVGYLKAIEEGAEVIFDTDDDNIPKDNWEFPKTKGSYLTIDENSGFVNTYSYFTNAKIWPRGLPLNLINSDKTIIKKETLMKCKGNIGIWQGLADGDPDVDAIYRLTNNSSCIFEENEPIVLSRGTVCPFNSQNTATIKKFFSLLYLPSFVTFRFTDILRGLIAQPILWSCNYNLGFTKATVFQDRNEHDYLKDFESEIPCYLNSEKVINIVSGVVSSSRTIEDNLYNSYEALENKNIVNSDEIELLELWLKDIKNI